MSFDWREADDDTIEWHFNPRVSIENAEALIAANGEKAAAAKAEIKGRFDIRYGARPKETLDLIPATSDALGTPAPAQIFIHGGYWRAQDKENFYHIAPDITAAGVTHITLNYDLCPAVTVADIVDEIANAVTYVYENAGELGIDRDRLFIAGHSAGGHLTGMMLAQDWPARGLPADVFKGAVPISGVFEPEVITHTSVNAEVHLDAASARPIDALVNPPRATAPVIAAVGGDEPEGFHVQSQKYVEVCHAAGLPAEYISIPGHNHMTVLEYAYTAGTDLFEKMLGQMR